MLIQMLLRGEEDLTGVKGPIVFPIFGRGRILSSFHGDELTKGRMEQVAKFLCAACSCLVKELNPGVDMLMGYAWEDRLAAASEGVPSGEVERISAPRLTNPPRHPCWNHLPRNST